MCRASTHRLGGYRCIDRDFLLEKIGILFEEQFSYKESMPALYEEKVPDRGAFWLRGAVVPSLQDIHKEVESVKELLSDKRIIDPRKEEAVNHLGNMISVYSDSKIIGLDNKMITLDREKRNIKNMRDAREISKEEFESLKETHDQESLALGFEVKENVVSTLKQLTSFGESLHVKGKGRYARISNILEDSSMVFPSQWNAIRGKNPFSFTENPRNHEGAYFRTDSMEMYIPENLNREIYEDTSIPGSHGSPDDNAYWQQRRVLIHESCHYYESVAPQLQRLLQAFRDRRVDACYSKHDYDSLRKFSLSGYDPKVKFYIDHFSNPYVGFDYDGKNALTKDKRRNFEVLSIGMESIMAGQEGSLIGLNGRRPDPDHRNTILGILAAVDLPKPTTIQKLEEWNTKQKDKKEERR
jgi:hypothetical protein